MDLLHLWQWSTAVQLSSLAMIALFFAMLSRSVLILELRWWVAAWICNFAALAVALGYWYLQPPAAWLPPVRAIYMTTKLAFLLLLLHGAWRLRWPGTHLVRRSRALLGVGAYAVVTYFLVGGIDQVGLVQHVALGFFFALGAGFLLRRPLDPAVSWLAAAFAFRSVLAFVEAAAYGLQLLVPQAVTTRISWFVSAHSSFDSGAEWFIALGCVLALSERTQRELHRANAHLLLAQEDLRRLVDRDPLTGLANRRSLPEIFREVRPRGAMILFFDLDDFKSINDLRGHQAGDDCLERFAAALKECFRPCDFLVRYAGDEFLAVASGLDRSAVDERIEKLRSRFDPAETAGEAIRFSVGLSELAPGGDPEAALREADASMYERKSSGNAPRKLATA